MLKLIFKIMVKALTFVVALEENAINYMEVIGVAYLGPAVIIPVYFHTNVQMSAGLVIEQFLFIINLFLN